MEPDISAVSGSAVPVALAVITRESGTIRSVNDRFCAQFAYDRETLLDRSLSWLTAEGWSPDVPLSDRLANADDERTRLEWQCQDGDGGTAWYELSVSPLSAEHDYAVVVCHGVSTDRDDRRQLEYRSALLEAQAEATIDGILVVNEDREIVSYNSRFLDIWEVSEELVADGSDEETLDAILDKLADPEEFLERVEYLYENPQEESRDEIRTADGRWLDRYSAPVVGDDGTQYGRLWVFRDITERKDREQRLEKFASVVSHDLRNPLDVAIGRIDVLDNVGEVPEELEPHIEEVEGSLHRMARLIDDLLTLTKQGGNVSETESVDVDAVARDAWGNVATDDATLDTESAVTVEADNSRLVQLLENLFRNAVEHGGDDVTVTVGSIETTDGMDAAGFFVADDGSGIPVDDPEEIFDYGFTTSEDGTGFGLAIVTDIARGHDWETTVTDSKEGGARFEFHI